MMKALNWHQAIEEASRKYRVPSKDQVIQVARELFPEEMKLSDPKATLRGHKRDLSDAMRRSINIDEKDTEYFEELPLLPGMGAPSYLGVQHPDTKETVPVRYKRTTQPERLKAIQERRTVSKRIEVRANDLEMKENFLEPHIESEDELLEDTLMKISNSGNLDPIED